MSHAPTESTPTPTPSPSPSSPLVDLSNAFETAVERAAPSVVRVASPRGHNTSGTVWTETGLILTTHRGTRRASSFQILDEHQREREAELVGRDPGTDLVLLRTDPEGLAPIDRVPADHRPKVGAWSLALARPGWRIRASLRAVGLVGPGFRTHQGGRVDAWIETDRALPSGFSGGPLIDVHGRMLGLGSRGLVRHADLAVPVATLDRVVAELLEHGVVRHGWLGVSLVGVELPSDSGPDTAVLIAGLASGGPAASAGLLIGDVVTAVDGLAIDGPSALREVLRGRAGQPITVDLIRAGAPEQRTVTPTEAPN